MWGVSKTGDRGQGLGLGVRLRVKAKAGVHLFFKESCFNVGVDTNPALSLNSIL